jgi:predicted flap endonuclease-1-like 5' DNA nuclease
MLHRKSCEWSREMSWTRSFHDEPNLEKAMRAPIGAVSPLWWAFAGAATAGVAYWWLARWAKPVNIEAPEVLPVEAAIPPALEEAAATYDLSPEAIEDVVDTPPTDEPAQALTETYAQAYSASGDDLTQLIGVGPKLALALADKGVTKFSQIAAWTEDDLAFFDRQLNLRGRAVRERWTDQARTLSLGGEAGR